VENTKEPTSHNSKLVLHIIRYIEKNARGLLRIQMESKLEINPQT